MWKWKEKTSAEEAGETTNIFLSCSDFNTWIVLSDFVVVKIKIFKTYFSVNDNNEEKIEERTLSVSVSSVFLDDVCVVLQLLFPEKRDTLTDENAAEFVWLEERQEGKPGTCKLTERKICPWENLLFSSWNHIQSHEQIIPHKLLELLVQFPSTHSFLTAYLSFKRIVSQVWLDLKVWSF